MKLVALNLKIAIQNFTATKNPEKRKQIAVSWFERNAEVTLEEIQKFINERET